MESKNFLFSLIAIFLALGIGILVGASMGEEALVMNQIVVIERLKEEIIHYKEEIDHYIYLISCLKEDLGHWESLERDYLDPLLIKNQLQEVSVNILTQENLPAEVVNFLGLSGCSYTTFHFTNTEVFQEKWFQDQLKNELHYDLDNGPSDFLATELSGLLQNKNISSGNKIIEILKSRKILEVIEQGPEQTYFLPVSEEDTGANKMFFAVGKIDNFLQLVINKIFEEGGMVIYLINDEEKDGGKQDSLETAGYAGNVHIVKNFNKFFNRLELLKIIQEINSDG